MTSSPTLQVLGDCDDPASVLGFAKRRKADEDQAGIDVLVAAARWVSMHSTEALVGPADAWHERALPLGGEGCPEVAEFAVAEFAAGLGKSTESGRRYLARAVEGHYRLTRCWARLEAGDLPAWRLGMIADQTMALSPAAAAFVDQHVAAVAHTVGPAQLMRLVEEAKARFDPGQTEADRLAAAETRKVDIDLAGVGADGVVSLDAGLDLADALDLETAVADLAHQLLLAGDDSPLDVRRSKALGLLARGQQALDLVADKEAERRRVVLHVHLAEAALTRAAVWPGSMRQTARSPPSRSASGVAPPTSPSSRSSTWPRASTSMPTRSPTGSATRSRSATTPASSPTATAPPSTATSTTSSPTSAAARPAPTTSRCSADDITATRPPAAGPTGWSTPASTSGAAHWVTTTCARTPAPPTSASSRRSTFRTVASGTAGYRNREAGGAT
jgi:hypothetical protein